jgi:hypothetical protein
VHHRCGDTETPAKEKVSEYFLEGLRVTFQQEWRRKMVTHSDSLATKDVHTVTEGVCMRTN